LLALLFGNDMGDDSPAWLVYERCVAAFVSEKYGGIDTSVQPNVTLRGTISGADRQIDVLIDHRWRGGTSSRILVDAKSRARPLDLGDVEQFEGMMRDCRASRGIIVCTAGWTAAAARRAQQTITITLLDYETALDEYVCQGGLVRRWQGCVGS
jgi:restriction endonuclease Mrr